MENSLTKYFNKRLEEQSVFDNNYKESGPVITISREVGCNGIKLAKRIAQRLNTKSWVPKWEVLSKEIFFESAKELNLEPEKVRHVLKRTDKYTFEEILDAFNNKNYKNERIVIKSVIKSIRKHAADGHCIIVGRAGHIIAKNIKNALHIRLFAPLEYRIQTIAENNHLNSEQALLLINKVEKERVAFRKAIRDETNDNYLFDLHINRATFGEKEIIDVIEHAIERKQLLKNELYKVQYY